MGNAPPQCCPGVREQILLKRRRTIVHGVVEALDLADGTLEQRCAQYKLKEATISLIKWKEAQKDGKRAIAKSLEILFDSKILFNQENPSEAIDPTRVRGSKLGKVSGDEGWQQRLIEGLRLSLPSDGIRKNDKDPAKTLKECAFESALAIAVQNNFRFGGAISKYYQKEDPETAEELDDDENIEVHLFLEFFLKFERNPTAQTGLTFDELCYIHSLGQWSQEFSKKIITVHNDSSHHDEGKLPLPADNRDTLIDAEKIFNLNYE